MDEIKGKKLLILGANPETVPLVQRANELGVHTIVTDYTPGAFAKKFAAESYDVDGMDVEALVDLGKRLNVDGVLVGVADRLIVPYQQVCEQVGLPCYGTAEQCQILTDKIRFNQECQKYGISNIPTYPLSEELEPEIVEQLRYPILIKPADSNSGKGMSICYQESELQDAVSKALKYSNSKRFLTERYMDCDDLFIFYTFVNGVCWPSVIADRFTNRGKSSHNPVCLGAVSPSKYTELYYKILHDKMCEMFHDMGMQNGVLMISAFVEDNNFYVYDPGFRLQGEAPNLTVQEITGFDHLKMLIQFALTGKNMYGNTNNLKDCRNWGRHAATIWYLLSAGTIEKIDGWKDVIQDSSVFCMVTRLHEGDTVTEDMLGTEQQVFARVYLTCDTLGQLKQKIRELQSAISVQGRNQNNMLISGFSVDEIYAKK